MNGKSFQISLSSDLTQKDKSSHDFMIARGDITRKIPIFSSTPTWS